MNICSDFFSLDKSGFLVGVRSDHLRQKAVKSTALSQYNASSFEVVLLKVSGIFMLRVWSYNWKCKIISAVNIQPPNKDKE